MSETKTHNNEVEQSEVTLGHTLREARKQQGLSIDDVVNQIKLAPRQIEALETDDYESLPEATFVRGFVRSYAKALHLDAVPLLALLPTESQVMPSENPTTEATLSDSRTMPKKQLTWLLALVFLITLVVFLIWQFTSLDKKISPQLEQLPIELPESVEIISSAPSDDFSEDEVQSLDKMTPDVLTEPVVISPQEKSQADKLQVGAIRLVFDNESWVEIRDKNKLLSSQLNLVGSELIIEGRPPFSLVIGRADAVHLYYRGEKIDLTSKLRSSSGVARLTLE